jgi:hypothetical protein
MFTCPPGPCDRVHVCSTDGLVQDDNLYVLAIQGRPKQINRTGTRFTATTERGDTPSSEGSSTPAASSAAADSYSVLATPSFTPGVEDSPFMTWGELEGTPLRLDPEDDIIVQPASGPHFRVPDVSRAACCILYTIYLKPFSRPAFINVPYEKPVSCSSRASSCHPSLVSEQLNECAGILNGIQ